ncbi:hypothetical protein [Ruminococcus sp.]|jgi:hypothetical protein|nr:hypothetical protein [Ruminococcus sp.]
MVNTDDYYNEIYDDTWGNLHVANTLLDEVIECGYTEHEPLDKSMT